MSFSTCVSKRTVCVCVCMCHIHGVIYYHIHILPISTVIWKKKQVHGIEIHHGISCIRGRYSASKNGQWQRCIQIYNDKYDYIHNIWLCMCGFYSVFIASVHSQCYWTRPRKKTRRWPLLRLAQRPKQCQARIMPAYPWTSAIQVWTASVSTMQKDMYKITGEASYEGGLILCYGPWVSNAKYPYHWRSVGPAALTPLGDLDNKIQHLGSSGFDDLVFIHSLVGQ